MITLDRGIKIRGLDPWLDATRSQPSSFVSHAHQDHVARHQQAISPLTANLLQERDTGIKKITRLNFHEPFHLNRVQIELFPPFLDHADFGELLTYVKQIQPRKVYTVHGFPELATALKKIGFSATPLENNRQLKLWKD